MGEQDDSTSEVVGYFSSLIGAAFLFGFSVAKTLAASEVVGLAFNFGFDFNNTLPLTFLLFFFFFFFLSTSSSSSFTSHLISAGLSAGVGSAGLTAGVCRGRRVTLFSEGLGINVTG